VVRGGNLASIVDSFENTAVYSGIGAYQWIGLSNVVSEDTWAWEDGTTFDYTNWGDGEPLDDSSRRCVGVDDSGGWANYECSNDANYACRYDS